MEDLIKFIEVNDLEEINTLIDNNNDIVNQYDENGMFPIHHAAQYGTVDSIKLLTDKGSHSDSINSVIFEIMTFRKNYEIAEALLECGATIDFEDDSGIPLLHRFVTLKDFDAVKFLVEHGSEALSKPNEDGLTPYQQAILDNEIDLLPLLCQGDVPSSSLQFAMTADSPEAIRTLSSLGADPNALINGDTLLMIAAAGNSVENLEALIDSGACVDKQSPEDGQTALHRAVIAGSTECAECLLQHGARTDIRDFDNNVPKDYIEKGNGKLTNLFGETNSSSSCCILI